MKDETFFFLMDIIKGLGVVFFVATIIALALGGQP